eukprot:1158425-Pelagomonas_calceolata.AAC.8
MSTHLPTQALQISSISPWLKQGCCRLEPLSLRIHCSQSRYNKVCSCFHCPSLHSASIKCKEALCKAWKLTQREERNSYLSWHGDQRKKKSTLASKGLGRCKGERGRKAPLPHLEESPSVQQRVQRKRKAKEANLLSVRVGGGGKPLCPPPPKKPL